MEEKEFEIYKDQYTTINLICTEDEFKEFLAEDLVCLLDDRDWHLINTNKENKKVETYAIDLYGGRYKLKENYGTQ